MPIRPTRAVVASALCLALVALPAVALVLTVRLSVDLVGAVLTGPGAGTDAAGALLAAASTGLVAVLGWAQLAVVSGVHDAWADAWPEPGRAGSASGPGPGPGPGARGAAPGRLLQTLVAGVVLATLTAPAAGAAVRAPVAAFLVLEEPAPTPAAPAETSVGTSTETSATTSAAEVAVPGSWSALAGEPAFTPPRTVAPASAALVTGAPSRQPAEPPQVVVRAGDSLWSLVRAHLGPDADDAQVAAVWPAWWQANRVTIGDDPDLITPGQLLAVPTSAVEEKP